MYKNCYFKLSTVLDANHFNRIFSKHNPFEIGDNEYLDLSLVDKGITVLYRNSQYKKKVSLIVDVDSILKRKKQDEHKLIHKLEKRIGEYFGGRYSLDDFMLAEVTLAANISMKDQDIVAAYIRVIQRLGRVKGFTPVHYEGFDKATSFCLEGNSNGINFLLYDLWTMAVNGFKSELTHKERRTMIGDSKGILRAEVQLTEQKAIRTYSSKKNTIGQILDLLERRDEIFMSTFVQIIPCGDFYKKGDAVEIVRQRVKDLRLQRKMLRLITLISEKKSLLLAQKAMSYREPNKLLIAFAEIGLSPVTISRRTDVKYLPSLYSYMD